MQENENKEEVYMPSVGEQLRTWRRSAGITVEQIAAELNMRPQIVIALEAGDMSVFSARVYALGYLTHIVNHFAIPEGSKMVDALRGEWEVVREKTGAPIGIHAMNEWQKWYITPARLLGIGGICALVFFFWLLGTQLIGFTGAPRLSIEEPSRDSVVNVPMVRVQGTTDKESQLTVNGREITMNERGGFDQEIELVAGLNKLDFLVQNRFGKVSQETRYVVVR
ncbi:MAG: helix-turn-helix domain-containing protein [Candidatus Sungbacteria bacterium]|nr:helix-turn-helix domain-containing protein [bacterium]MDZ4260427.1 helix-turn-helix domain-containing protein [Candidatus Sungbacteria bacterium]